MVSDTDSQNRVGAGHFKLVNGSFAGDTRKETNVVATLNRTIRRIGWGTEEQGPKSKFDIGVSFFISSFHLTKSG